MKKLIAFFILLAPPAFSAISANTVWYVLPGGSATNGGGVVAGSTVNMANFTNKNAAACTSCYSSTADISTTDAVAVGTTTITSATAAFDSNITGQSVYFAGGTGTIAAQWRQATYVSATTITIDASIAASTGMTMNIGGGLDLPITLASAMVTSNTGLIKANTGTFTVTNSSTTLTPSSGNLMVGAIVQFTTTGTLPAPLATATNYYVLSWSSGNATVGLACGTPPYSACGANAAPISFSTTGSGTHTVVGLSYTQTASASFSGSVTPGQSNRLIGYTATPGDNGRAYITLGTNTGLTALTSSGNGWDVANIAVDCASLGTSSAFNFSGSYSSAVNLKARNCTTQGIDFPSGSVAMSESVGGPSAAGITAGYIYDSYAHDGGGISANTLASGNLVTNITSGGGLTISSFNIQVTYNTVDHVTSGDCLKLSQAFTIPSYIRHNLFSNCGNSGQYGISLATNTPARAITDGNSYLLGWSGGYTSNLTNAAGVYAYAPYVNRYDRLLQANPYNNTSGADYSLNVLPGGGASVRGFGFLGDLPGYVGAGYNDMGALSHYSIPLASSGLIKGPVFVSAAVPAAPLNLVADGDSITAGYNVGVNNGYANQARTALATYIQFTNLGVAGKTCENIVTDYPTNAAPLYSTYYPNNVFSIMCGTNDTGESAATAYAALSSIVSLAQATGYTVWVGLIPDKTGSDTFVQAYNTLIVNGATAGNYAVFGSLGTSPMYCNGCSASSTYFQGDGTHPTLAGQTVIEGYYIPLINALGIN